MREILLGSKAISLNSKPYFIADIAANHDGDLSRAYTLIELAKESGADAAKFQNFKAKTIVSRKGFDELGNAFSHQKNWDKPVYDVYDAASVSDDWSPLLKEKCDSVGIEYITSPYDFHSVDVADKYSVCFKIGSGDITWIDIVDYIAQKKKPVLLATGASTLEDVKRAVQTIMRSTNDLVLMQCNTNYTANDENFKYINLSVLTTYSQLFPEAVLGLSDHTFGHTTVLGALMLGARVIEKHFTDDNSRRGPDHRFSMNPTTWKTMVREASNLLDSIGDGVKRIEDNEKETAIVQRRALYYTTDLSKGDYIEKDKIFPVRPAAAGSIPPYRINEILGKKLLRSVEKDTIVKHEDFSND